MGFFSFRLHFTKKAISSPPFSVCLPELQDIQLPMGKEKIAVPFIKFYRIAVWCFLLS